MNVRKPVGSLEGADRKTIKLGNAREGLPRSHAVLSPSGRLYLNRFGEDGPLEPGSLNMTSVGY